MRGALFEGYVIFGDGEGDRLDSRKEEECEEVESYDDREKFENPGGLLVEGIPWFGQLDRHFWVKRYYEALERQTRRKRVKQKTERRIRRIKDKAYTLVKAV